MAVTLGSLSEANMLVNKLIEKNVLSERDISNTLAEIRSEPSMDAPSTSPPPQKRPKLANEEKPALPSEQEKKKKKKVFDPSNSLYRHVCLRLSYDGSNYFGFTENLSNESANADSNVESNTVFKEGAKIPANTSVNDTVEYHMFKALVKARLVVDRFSCNYTRCGRTDRGVSAFGQVICLKLRSAFPKGFDEKLLPGNSSDQVEVSVTKKAREMDYCKMLNGLLPEAIRFISWAPVSPEFSARFSCTSRTYRYFFVRRNLDILRMNEALSKIVGEHDFRNLAKMNVENVSNYKRLIFEAKVVVPDETKIDGGLGDDVVEKQICYFEIKGQAFLWHMIRNIVSVMFFVGKNLEEPSVVDDLLDIEKMPRKPNYDMALDTPLVLNDCEFLHVKQNQSAHNLWELTRHFEKRWEEYSLKAAQARDVLKNVEKLPVTRNDLADLRCNVLRKWRKEGRVDEIADENSIPPIPGSDYSSDYVSWASALRFLSSKGLFARPDKEGAHQLLRNRNGGSSYEEKISNMSGKRKERYERNVVKQNAGSNVGFYKEKQALG